MLFYRNNLLSKIRQRLPIIKFQSQFSSEISSDNNNNDSNTGESKSLVEKLDLLIKKADRNIELEKQKSLLEKPQEEQIEDQEEIFNEIVSSSKIEENNEKTKRKISAKLTPWTNPNSLKPMAFAEFAKRRNTTERKSFASLLRHSTFVQLGNSENVCVIGVVVEVVNSDLYIDFGGKFLCVCQQSSEDTERYVRGSLVRLLLKDPEMVAAFMLDKVATTVLEAKAVLLGPVTQAAETDIECLWTPV